MVLKQRFADGRTNFTDIGNDFQIETPASPEWGCALKNLDKDFKTDVVAVLTYNINQATSDHVMQELIYKDFQQWIYSNDGQLFLTLN